MKIQQVQSNLNFEAKKRFIDSDSHYYLEKLLDKMDEETVYKSNEYHFESSRLTRLTLCDTKKACDKAELVDTRRFLDKVPEKNKRDSETLLTIGKTQLVIKNSNGEIIDYYKPFLKPWKKVIKQAGEVIKAFLNLYNTPEMVMKHRFNIDGFTKKGFEVLEKIKVK